MVNYSLFNTSQEFNRIIEIRSIFLFCRDSRVYSIVLNRQALYLNCKRFARRQYQYDTEIIKDKCWRQNYIKEGYWQNIKKYISYSKETLKKHFRINYNLTPPQQPQNKYSNEYSLYHNKFGKDFDSLFDRFGNRKFEQEQFDRYELLE